MLAFVRKLFSRKDDAAASGQPTQLMQVHCGDFGWEGRLSDPFNGTELERFAEPIPLEIDAGDKALDEAFRLAGAKLSARDAKQIKDVVVLTDDPDIHYTDMLADAYKAASVASLREIGMQYLGGAKVTFGKADLAATNEGGQAPQRGAIAWGDVKRTGAFLTRLSHIAPKVVAVVPLTDVLVRQVARPGGEVGAALHLGAHTTRLVLVNAELGAVMVRTVPIGFATLILKVATESGITIEEASRNLRTSDYISKIRLNTTDTMARSQVERILGDDLRRLMMVIRETLDFFDLQRFAGRPETIRLFGDLDRVSGLVPLIRANLPVQLEVNPVSVFDAFCALEPKKAINLLEHVGTDLRIGTIVYGYRENRLVPAVRPSQDPGRVDQQVSRARHRLRSQRRSASGRSGKGGLGAETAGGLLDRVASLLGPPAANENGTAADDEATSERKDMMWAAGFAAVALVVIFLGYGNFADASTAFHSRGGAVVEAQENNRRLRDNLGRIQQQATSDDVDADKVLWAEKFLAIAKTGVMDEGMWLTDVYLTGEQHTGASGQRPAVNKKLVMEGAVLPSTIGHIQHIADYIERLQEKTNFMSDFRETNGLTFEGARMEQSDTDSIIRFHLDAWYDANRRIQGRPATVSNTSSPSVANTVSAAQLRNQETEKSLVTSPATR